MGMLSVNAAIIIFISYIIWVIYRLILWRKNKKINYLREILMNIFFIYLLIVLSLTLFKMGELMISSRFNRTINIVPVIETIRMFNGSGSLRIAIYNVVGNSLVLIPFGFMLPILFEKTNKISKIAFYGAITSIFIEFCQYFTVNNTTDIDDVILNTFGAVIGLVCYRVFIKILKAIKLINLVEKITDKENKKLLRLAIKPLSSMVAAALVLCAIAFYNNTFSNKLSDKDLYVHAFNQFGGELVASKELKDKKLLLVDNKDFLELEEMSKTIGDRYVRDPSMQMDMRNRDHGYYIDILYSDNGHKAQVVAFGKNKNSKTIEINFNGKLIKEELKPKEFFIVAHPYNENLAENSDVYNFGRGECKDLTIKFYDDKGKEDKDMEDSFGHN
ncbi:VanZ family protein [Clostridium sp. C8-1-8]|uniref:VanZ family protein n=1 Tax=Clostridium sp. C8-1-8 TaxID=2698831 RepID=UPI00136E62A3|nr:VanZ family protein [Clostridium sp. C8-1-8]